MKAFEMDEDIHRTVASEVFGVPLEQVLNYMSRAAGFIIHPKVTISGKVDAWSDNPLTKDEALDLLEHVLDDNGYTVVRDGKILTIMSKIDAKHTSPIIKRFTTLDDIPKNDEVATYIIPVRTLNPIAPTKIRRRVTRPRLAIISAEATEPTAIEEVKRPKLAASALSTYSAISGRIVWKL